MSMNIDMHVHTSISACSQLPLDNLLRTAPDRGLYGVCITDHDTMAVRNHLREGLQQNGLCVIFGMEYATSDGDFLLFGPFEELESGLAAPALLRHVQAAGGVAVAAHPGRQNRSAGEHLIRQGLCTIIESINGRNRPHENDAVASWNARYGVRQVGGSDAHTIEELGRVSTRFSTPIRSRAELINALKHGEYAPAQKGAVTCG